MYFPYDFLNILFSLLYGKTIIYNTYNMQNRLTDLSVRLLVNRKLLEVKFWESQKLTRRFSAARWFSTLNSHVDQGPTYEMSEPAELFE